MSDTKLSLDEPKLKSISTLSKRPLKERREKFTEAASKLR
jgi:hypothetical protein